jgi:hypothetical protein
VSETVCMVFQPVCKRMPVATEFLEFLLDGITFQYVSEFRYLGHIIMISNKLIGDNDIH